MPRLSPEQIEAFRQWSVGAVDATEHYARQMMREVLAELADVTRQRDESDADLLLVWPYAEDAADEEMLVGGIYERVEAARARQSAAVKADETLPDQA